MKNTTNNKWWMTYLLLTAGTFFMAVGINVIYEPLSMVTGGFSGIGILVKKLTQTARWSGIPVGMTTLLLNIPLFIRGYCQKGKAFVKKTVYAASCFSFFLLIVPTFDIVKQDYLMAALVGGLLNGSGIGLVFSQGASTGGSDLLSVLTAKILPGLSASERLILIDTLIVAAGVFIFGLEIGLYAVVAVFVTGKVSDAILDGLKFAKIAYIISDHPEEISEHILRELGRGLTGLEGQGMYSEKHKMVLMCVVSKKEAVLLKDIVKSADNEAFLILSEAKEVLGEGFWREMK
ncbi:MAG: YitT family protein [Eubacterium sp.]|nr:YitT family protein [Eubacterium sp.]